MRPASHEPTGEVLRTKRIELSPFGPGDVTALHSLFVDADVRRYLLDDFEVPLEWVEAEVETSMARFDAGGVGLWAMRKIGSSDIIGFVGFRPFFDPPELQLLYGLRKAHWGHGFATEGGQAAIDYAVDRLGLHEIRAATDVPNEASVAVLERLGMREWKRTDEGEYGTIFFRMEATG